MTEDQMKSSLETEQASMRMRDLTSERGARQRTCAFGGLVWLPNHDRGAVNKCIYVHGSLHFITTQVVQVRRFWCVESREFLSVRCRRYRRILHYCSTVLATIARVQVHNFFWGTIVE